MECLLDFLFSLEDVGAMFSEMLVDFHWIAWYHFLELFNCFMVFSRFSVGFVIN